MFVKIKKRHLTYVQMAYLLSSCGSFVSVEATSATEQGHDETSLYCVHKLLCNHSFKKQQLLLKGRLLTQMVPSNYQHRRLLLIP